MGFSKVSRSRKSDNQSIRELVNRNPGYIALYKICQLFSLAHTPGLNNFL